MTIGILLLVYLFWGALNFVASWANKRMLTFFSLGTGLSALTVHGGWLVRRGIESRHLPFTNTYETLIFLGFLIVLIFFLTFPRHRLLSLGGFAGVIVSVLLALTSLLVPDIEPLLPALKSNWLLFHVVSAFLGYSGFALASAAASLYLGFSVSPHPNQERLDYLGWLTYRFITFGFPFLTLGIATGAIWANESWGHYWNWDPKETWAFITWVMYAIYLHMHSNPKANPKWLALMTLIGFATVMFTYFGVNFWLASLHAAYA